MEPSQPRPKSSTRKGRWRICVGLILSCAALLLWLLWQVPLNDVEQKLVGTWTPGHARGLVFITMNADRTISYHDQGGAPSSGNWNADASTFYMDEGIQDVLTGKLQKLLHGGPDRHTYTLMSVEEDCLRFFVPINGATVEYIRVPDSSPGMPSGAASQE